ncbi:MAG: adenylate/guanylate cyclase domain-containing protein, partial [Pirellulaceae bacterium]
GTVECEGTGRLKLETTTSTTVATDQALALRQFVERMREDLLRAAAMIVGHSQMLWDEARIQDCPEPLLSDLDKLLEAAKSLYRSVRECLDGKESTGSSAETLERLRMHRHDIANQLNQVLGFCQLLLLQQHDYFGRLTEDLELIQTKCKACVATLQRYKTVGLDHRSVAGEPALDDGAAIVVDSESFQHAIASDPAKVLVADDNQTNREQLAALLQRQQHQVVTAANGREALAALERDDFDLILLDVVMPELNGFQTLERLKADERLRHIPVIMVSGFSDVDHVVTCIAMGADDHLPKPVDHRLLLARVNSCLEKKRLREREFGQFFTPELARHFVRHPELLKQGREADVTILFCDIRGFSRISERLGPNDTVRWLSDVMSTLSECVIQHRGVLVDYIGDELMAMWGAPEEQPHHAEQACRAAIDILGELPELSQRWQHLVPGGTDVGIGLNSGIARVGNTGSDRKFKYGALGDTVNLASRVQGATKFLRTRLLVTSSTHGKLGEEFNCRRLCRVRVVNIDRSVELYEIVPQSDGLNRQSTQRYEEALAEFEQKNLLEAASLLGKLLGEDPQDGPSLLLMSRIVDALVLHPDGFDPVWELPGK